MFRSLAHLFAATDGPAAQRRLHRPPAAAQPLARRGLGRCRPPSRRSTPHGEGKPPFLGSDEIVEVLDLPDPFAGRRSGPGAVRPRPRRPGSCSTTRCSTSTSCHVRDPWLIADHLAYAYLIESTGVFEIMAEVVRRLVVGETLDTLSADGHPLAAGHRGAVLPGPAAVLHLRDAQRGAAAAPREPAERLLADVRAGAAAPDPRTVGRTPGYGAQPWQADTGSVNTDFREKWAELLRQVWLGIENQNNGIGPNATDAEFVAFLAEALRDMLGDAPPRRAAGARGVRLRLHDELVPPHLGVGHADRDRPQGPGHQRRRPPGQDRPAGRHGAGGPVPRAVRAVRPDVGVAAGHRARALRHRRGGPDAVPAGSAPTTRSSAT